MFESEFEQNLYTLRREKLKQIAALGQLAGLNEAQATYPNSFSTSHTIPEVRAAFDELSTEQLELNSVPITVRVAGRIMAIRVQGKAGFAQLQQGGQRLQIYVRKDDVGENAFAIYKLLDLGDHIGVSGHLFRTRTGELTVHVSTITFLTKAMLALPDKFHGLADTELRYRQRYVDLFMNTGALRPATNPGTTNPGATNPGAPGLALADLGEAPQASPEATEEDSPRNVREVFVKRAAVLRAIRRFFDQLGYLEVETPMMQQIPGGAAARPFTTHHNELDLDLYLRIAPELYLKRLVVGGLDRVYEINRNFRNEGMSTRHNPEFTMLEFYQAYANYHDLMRLTEELIIFVAEEVNGTTITHFNGNEIDLSKWQRYSMREAIIHFWPESAGARPDPSVFDSTESVVALVHQLRAAKVSIVYEPGEPVGKTIATVFETVAGEHLVQPTIIYDFPLAISPLSKIKHDEPDWVERFEFFIGGFEVGNAFSELNDPEDQRRRFLDQLEQKERGDHEAHHMDEDYIRALGYGLPPTAGEGIGIDRLTMLLTNSRSIRDVILFPLMRPQTKPQQSSSSSPAISLDSLDSLDKPHGESAE